MLINKLTDKFADKPIFHLKTNQASQLISFIQSKKPVKISGLIDHWPALKWTFQSLSDLHGQRTVKALLDLPNNNGGILFKDQSSYEQMMAFSDFITRALQPHQAPCYLGYLRATDLLSGYENNYDFSSLTPLSSYPTDTRLWIGSMNTCSGLHSDLKDNIFSQLVGTKKVFLVPFNQSHLVYPFIDNIVNSQVNPEKMDTKKFPKFMNAHLYSTTVEPGEILFIPRGWWHYLHAETPSISINHWFGQPISSATYLMLLTRLGPRYIWQTIKDMVRYSILKKTYKKEFFFTPASTGERLFNLIRYGDFSKENNPIDT